MRVLLVINENPISVDLVRGVLSLSDLETIHVRILFPVALQERPALEPLDLEWLRARAEYAADRCADVFRARGLQAESLVRFGSTSSAVIIQEARQGQADWIVLGQKLDEVADGWLADSTVQYVSNYAPCSVKVVPLENWHGTL